VRGKGPRVADTVVQSAVVSGDLGSTFAFMERAWRVLRGVSFARFGGRC